MTRLERGGWSLTVRGAPAGGAELLAERFEEGGLARIAGTSGAWSLEARRGDRLLVATDAFAGAPLFVRGTEVFELEELADLAPGSEVEPRMVGQHLDAGLDDPTVTWLRGVRRVPGGWGGPPQALHRIWRPSPVPVDDPVAQLRAAVRALELPAGALALSGGLDSSVLATLPGPTSAICNAFPGWECDETTFAAAVAQRHGLALERVDSRAIGPADLAEVFAPPVLPPLFVNHYLNQALLQRSGGSLITGFGGDEVFGHGFGALAEWGRAGRLDRVWREAAWLVLREDIRHESFTRRLRRYGRAAIAASVTASWRGMSAWDRRWREITHPYLQRSREEQVLLAHDLGCTLHTPLLDPSLASLCLSIPDRARLERGRTRAMVRHAFAGDLPASVLERTDKADLSRSFDERFSALLPSAWPVIVSGVLDPWRSPRQLRALRARFDDGDHLAGAALWRAFGAARWLSWHAGRPRRHA